MISPQDCFLNVGAIRARYWQVGSSGSPVLLIHGITGSVEGFKPILEPLAAQHRVFTLDLPGHGLTDKPADFSYELPNLARFVSQFMDAVGLPRAHVVGHSLGGGVALSLAIQFPQRVDRLVLMNCACLGKEAALFFRLPTLPLVGEAFTRNMKPPTRESQKMFVYDLSVLNVDDMMVDYRHMLQPGAREAFLKILRKNVNLLGIKPHIINPILRALPSIQSPTLIIWGREDEAVPVKHGEVAARVIPHARLHVFEQCKHSPMIEKTAEVNRLIGEFLAD